MTAVFGAMCDTVPLCLNGIIGAHLHVPFPVAIRASFGFYFSRFAVVTRMITALFWHAIQTWTGSTAMLQVGYPSFILHYSILPWTSRTYEQSGPLSSRFQTIFLLPLASRHRR